MKYLIMLFITVTISGCATQKIAEPTERCPRNLFTTMGLDAAVKKHNECLERERADDVQLQAKRDEAEKLRKWREEISERMSQPGTKKSEFDKVFRKADIVDYKDGKVVYWYADPPTFVEFRNDLLVSFYADMETRRMQHQEASQRGMVERQMLQSAEIAHRQSLANAINQGFQQMQLQSIERNTRPTQTIQAVPLIGK